MAARELPAAQTKKQGEFGQKIAEFGKWGLTNPDLFGILYPNSKFGYWTNTLTGKKSFHRRSRELPDAARQC